MQFIHYLGGEARGGKRVAIGFMLSHDPASPLERLKGTMPFDLTLLAVEEGTPEKLEELQKTFKAQHLKGFWYKPSPELEAHVKAIEPIDPVLVKTTRVSLDLSSEEFVALELLVKETGTRGKAQLLRKAFKFYGTMYRYKAQGYMIQAVKGGKMIQFPDLDTTG